MSGHFILKIMKGVQVVPGDASSAEQGLDEVDLLTGGFNVDTYDMQLPGLKSSATWADSPLTDGRTLISGALGNVTETIRCELTAGTIIQLAAMLSKLLRFKQDCNDFWDTFGQIEPVYLKHQVDDEPGPRFALLYDIDIDVEDPLVPSTPTRTVTLSIERETYWRGLAPGDNPKKWNCFIDGVNFDTSNANLRSGVRHTVSANCTNKQEFNTIHTFLTQNFVDIPATKLVGDAPPLLCAVVNPSIGGAGELMNVYLARSTKPTTQPDREGNTLPRYNTFAGAAGSLGTDATFVTDATLGIKHIPVSPNARYVNVSFATATDQLRLQWLASSTFTHLNPNLLRGRYQILLRAEQNGGALGNTTLYVKFLNTAGYFFTSPTINPKITVAGRVQVNDLGLVTLPVGSNSYSGITGKGLSVANVYSVAGQDDGNFRIELYAARSTGVATLRIYDLILIPFDEGAVYIVPIAGASGGPESVIYDNTGYFTHGKPDVYAAGRLDDGSGGLDNEIIAEPRGSLELLPGVNNRIYIFAEQISFVGSNPTDTFSVFFNIVPRWSGLRDA